MTFIFEKAKLLQLIKAKHSILASRLHISQTFFLTEPHTYLYNTVKFL